MSLRVMLESERDRRSLLLIINIISLMCARLLYRLIKFTGSLGRCHHRNNNKSNRLSRSKDVYKLLSSQKVELVLRKNRSMTTDAGWREKFSKLVDISSHDMLEL